MGERKGVYKALVGKPERKAHLEGPGVDGRIILKWIFERLKGDIDWIDLAQDTNKCRALVNTVTNLRVPSNAGNFSSSLGRVSFSGRTVLHGVSQLVN
jgi:hypothetical protein